MKGDSSKLQQAHVGKIRLILVALHAATEVKDLNIPGWNLHPLKGDLKDHWSVKVNGNWRITFRFIDENIEVLDVNYLDYH